ncbi:MAG: glycosyltransferase [Bacteroidales bacterium]|nr:glycosyltransferase [Bacteroidales bacterium]MDD3663667.1 glycosyltransferase [Bacteroidales bacterium]
MSKNLKYLIIGDGASPHLLKWISALADHFDLYLISSRSVLPEIHSIIPDNQIVALNFSLDPDGGNLKMLSLLPVFIKQVKKWRPDILNAHYITSYGFLAAVASLVCSRRIILVQSAWGSDILVTPQKSMLYKMVTKFALNRGHLITSDARTMTEAIKKLTRNQVETFVFGLNSLPEISLSQKKPFSFFSNRAHTKNYRIDHVIITFGVIASNYPDAGLVIANSGPETESLQKLAQRLHLTNQIEFTGFLNPKQQNQYYHQSQFYFSLPESDSTSVSLLEAMAWGCIPIVSNIEANNEWIEDMKNGIYENAELIEKIPKVLATHHSIAAVNRQIISQRAIFPTLIQRYSSIIEKMASS